MRRFVRTATATALLATATWAHVLPLDTENINGHGAFITLNVGNSASIAATLRLDIYGSSNHCDTSRASIYGQPLPIDDDGNGEGDLRLGRGSVVSASWRLECIENDDGIEMEQRLEMILKSIDGEYVPDAAFIATFAPSTVDIDIESHALLSRPKKFVLAMSEYDENVVAGAVGTGSESDQDDIEETDGTKNESLSSSDSPASTLLQQCDTWRCITQGITNRVKQKLKEKLRPWGYGKHVPDTQTESTADAALSRPESSQPGISKTGDGDHFGMTAHSQGTPTEKPIKAPKQPSPTRSTSSSAYTPLLFPSIPPPEKDLLMTFCFAGLAFSLFSLFSIGVICSCCASQPPQIHRRRVQPRETPEERAARVENRKQAVRDFLRRIFCGLFTIAEKKDGEGTHEGGAASSSYEEDTSGTMEEELAGFREAASMVSNLIAAEEGRNRMVVMQGQNLPPPSLRPPVSNTQQPMRGHYPQSNPAALMPPSYENDVVDSSMVSDGFRQTSGGARYTPGTVNTPYFQYENSSDRLGYGNKD